MAGAVSNLLYALRMLESYTASMKNIQVKEVPDDVHRVWRQRAALEGMSLQEFLLRKLTAEARRPTAAELFERIEHRGGIDMTGEEAAEFIREDRDAR